MLYHVEYDRQLPKKYVKFEIGVFWFVHNNDKHNDTGS